MNRKTPYAVETVAIFNHWLLKARTWNNNDDLLSVFLATKKGA
ncbi:hypothetical protein ACVBIL_00215 [Shewanella sp. 125m-7]